MVRQKEHIEKIRREKFWINENGELNGRNPLIDDLTNSIERLSEGLYSKDTHFIFELIQNAEDNKYDNIKPSLSFYLTKNDPTDTPNTNGALIVQNNEFGFQYDDIEAICAIGKSTKNKIQGYIGEKGIGFKSVFRITSLPHIFSNGYQFCFPEKDVKTGLGYIVPQWLGNLPPEIDPKKTTIVLPLNKPSFHYGKIKEMLYDIEPETILFLSKLKEIHIKTDDGDNFKISKNVTDKYIIQLSIKGIKQNESYSDIKRFLLFSKVVDRPQDITHEKRINVNKREVTIAFPTDSRKESIGKIFAYLPVRADTGFPFLINADFILPSSREDIQDVPWNYWLMKCVANLLVDNLSVLKKERLLTVKFFELLASGMVKIDENSIYSPITKMVSDALLDRELLPADDGGFVSARNAKLARSVELRGLITHQQLKELFNSEVNLKWLSGEITEIKTPELRSYLLKNLNIKEFRPENIIELMTNEFFQVQSDDWIVQFYNFLNDNKYHLWEKSDSKLHNEKIRFIPLEDGSFVTPFKPDGKPNVYLPSSSRTNFPTVKKNIFNNKGVEEFLRNIGLIEPDFFAEIMTFILPKYDKDQVFLDFEENIEDLRKIYKLLSKKLHNESKNSVGELKILLNNLGYYKFFLDQFKLDNIEELKGKKIIPELMKMFLKLILPKKKLLYAINSKTKCYRYPKEIYFNTDELKMYFKNNPNVWFINTQYPDDLFELFNEISVLKAPKVYTNGIKNEDGSITISNEHSNHKRGLKGFNPDIEVDGLEFALNHPTIDKSLYVWEEIAIPNSDFIRGTVESSSRKNFENSRKFEQISPKFGRLLIDIPWIPDKQGNFHKPSELKLDDLPNSFVRDEKLADMLGMQKDEIKRIEEKTGGKFISREEYEEYKNWKEQRAKTEKNKNITKMETGSGKIDYKDKFKENFNRPGETVLQEQITDNGKVKAPGPRREKSFGAHKERIQNEPKPSERRKETMRTILEGPNEQVREYLSQFYDGKCQICGKTFPERNGKPFFIANYIVPKKLAGFIDTPANALCLCADHFARWQYGAVEAENILEQIDAYKTEAEGENIFPALRIKLCGEECNIKFKEKHLLDLQELLKASEPQNL